MPSTYSPNLRIELIATGEQSGTWGTTTNTNLGTLIEDAISGYVSVSVTSANQALTALNGVADQSRNMVINLTTTTAANFNVYIPPADKLYVIRNSSAHSATIFCSSVLGNTTAAGTGVTVPAGREMLVFSDATNVAAAVDYAPSLVLGAALPVTSGGTGVTTSTGSGNTVLSTSPSLTTPSLSAATVSTSATVTAGTNAQGQGALTSDLNVVTTAAANPSGVTLPTATIGRAVTIVNRGANPVAIFPATGAAIDGLAANASITLPINEAAQFTASSATQWYSSFLQATSVDAVVGVLPVASGGTGITSFGTGVATALGVNTGTAGAFVVNGGALGTPSSGTVTNLTGTASININGTVGATTANTGAFTTLSATGVTTVQAGTVSAPAITTAGDTNTGIFFPAADTIAFAEGGVEAMRIDASGNVGIGTSSPTAKLEVNGAIRIGTAVATSYVRVSHDTANGLLDTNVGSMGYAVPSSQIHYWTIGGTERARISAAGGFSVGTTSDPGAGAINATGNITAFFSSDRTLKENIRDIPDALNKACAIGGKLFDWTDAYIEKHGGADGYFVQKADFGVIAQDVQEQLPVAVRTRDDGTLAVDYEKMCALAFAAIAELRAEVEALKKGL